MTVLLFQNLKNIGMKYDDDNTNTIKIKCTSTNAIISKRLNANMN